MRLLSSENELALSSVETTWIKQFDGSRWFTRGWTLQELIAPYRVEFYAGDWSEIGSKSFLRNEIALITGIDPQVLQSGNLTGHNAARRMSWASRRETTREEDLAYCLLGLFDINMPMLYGEGGVRAFQRLQQQILTSTEDHSLLAWTAPGRLFLEGGLLAPSVRYFSSSSLVSVDSTNHGLRPNTNYVDAIFGKLEPEPWQITSRGLRISLPLRELKLRKNSTYLAWIYCRESEDAASDLICIKLKASPGKSSVFQRVNLDQLFKIPWDDRDSLSKPTAMYILMRRDLNIRYPYRGPSKFRFRLILPPDNDFSLRNWMKKDISLSPKTNSYRLLLRNRVDIKLEIVACCRHDGLESQVFVAFGFSDGLPWCTILTRKESFENYYDSPDADETRDYQYVCDQAIKQINHGVLAGRVLWVRTRIERMPKNSANGVVECTLQLEVIKT